MAKIKLENTDIYLNELLKDEKFRRLYEIECAKVALAQKIAELREDENLTQAELAKRLGVSQQFVSQIETGDEKNLTLETLIKIARSLGKGITISFTKLSKQHQFSLKVT
ncbi:MAG: hypothetical protein A2166_06255 [Omnitrophica WOR_2 bacterium RBG_13_41_10]|nr:MAG: hypothetical protein A2166_06255 [Omnitrophica WOR_2 bacterium RBG_13_41_10]